MRRSDGLLLVVLLALLLGELCWLDAEGRRRDLGGQAARASIVRRLGLTDLVLSTEARYTRHPSQADRFAPFQDHPHALDHFPSGSVVAPPPALR
ncbi:MAG: hypothetical protein IPO09_13130 [Anaeromyxobacter sp.]|nr:hypothetical protein [Anaeromyxobacter sp.]MBL0275130.1 hypothetical protein [Anaeromyxobacter sp.]